MRSCVRYLLIGATFLFVGCGTAPVADTSPRQLGEAGRVPGDAPAQHVPVRTVSHGSFGAYQAGVIGRGEKVALHFCAARYADCASAEMLVRAWYTSAESFPINAYSVDYNSPVAQELKIRFSVTDPDTWVVVDATGRYYRRVQGVDGAQLRSFLLANSSAS